MICEPEAFSIELDFDWLGSGLFQKVALYHISYCFPHEGDRMNPDSIGSSSKIPDRFEELMKSGVSYQDSLKEITKDLGISIAKASSIASFYDIDTGEDKICVGPPCALKYRDNPGSAETKHFQKESCLGYCDHAPVARIGGKYYTRNEKSLIDIEESTHEYVAGKRENYTDYSESGGYAALDSVLKASDYSIFLKRIQDSGLRGMGGAGFPAAAKWKTMPGHSRKEDYLLINGHEGEPGTFKDRVIMEIHPHRVIEGAVVVALLNDIGSVVIAIKSEYANAKMSMDLALSEFSEKYHEVFDRIDLSIVKVHGSYVTGEETALMESIEGKRGEPRLRPPFPTQRGLFGKPTLVHNVETVSHVPEIITSNGADISKYYCLTGDVRTPGLYLERLGIEANMLVENHGSTSNKDVKAFLPGGLSGGILPGSQIGLRLDYDSVRKVGAGLGTGAFISLSSERCIVDVSARIEKFFEMESCGKCTPCRLGTKKLSDLLDSVSHGTASEVDLEDAVSYAGVMVDGSICALGQAAGKLFLDSLTRFREEFTDHLNGKCPAKVCVLGSHHD